ncbi:MAG: hypothetical protein N2444_09840, partial [Methylocystis sp.]|nr:hypothetical protein [Methylocystis sp.]
YVLDYGKFVNANLFLLVASGSFTFLEPSPYDIFLFVFGAVWFFSGFRVHISVLPIVFLSALGLVTSFVSMTPWFHVESSTAYWVSSVYLLITLIFFSIVFGDDSARRAEVCLKGLLVSCVLAAVVGVMGWFDIGGTAVYFSPEKRAMGPFKDPNVFGSYLIVGHLYLMQRLMTGQTRGVLSVVLTIATMLLLLLGVFLSFSRGSWGSATLSSVALAVLTFFTVEEPRARRRLSLIFVVFVAVAVVGLLAALSVEQIHDMFVLRASVTQDYDVGETGRFGNQLRSIPMLLERPLGMGPLRFRTFFEIDPHNSYVGGFANHGWLGGLDFVLIVALSAFIGARLCIVWSPYRRPAHVFFLTMLMFFIQGFQIDIDHWRFVYLYIGVIWGLETGRQRWLERQARGGSEVALQS